MITILKRAFADFLALFARAVVRKYKPIVVMVTGSVGKTSTKDALAAALAPHLYIRKSQKSYNSEFGVPLTIFGVGNPWHSLPGWLLVLKEALTLIFLPNHYPKVLIIEVGADRPGDLAKILWIATPHVVVLTPLPEVPVHVEAYATPEAVREEEFAPAYALPPSAPLIIPADDPHARRMAARTAARVLSYGTALDADVRVVGVNFYEEKGVVTGMAANILAKEGDLPAGKAGKGTVIVKGSVGAQQVLPAAAALAASGALGVSFSDALAGLVSYEPPPGRGCVFNGKNGSIIIDDSYNSSPVAVEQALKTLQDFPHAKRRIAVLGDMLELGRYSVSEHERIGALAGKSADFVVSVGVRARKIAEAARAAGVPQEHIRSYDDSYRAAAALPELVREGDVVLVKGSQSVRTERIVEALLANPGDLPKLVRQEKEWKHKR